MGSQCSKMETTTSDTASMDMGESSPSTNREVRACIESFWNETMGSIKEKNREDDQRCYESDISRDITADEIKIFLRPVIQDSYCSISEDRPNPKTKISKWKLTIKAWLKEQFQGNGKGLVTKFFPVLRKLRKKYKTMAKKVTNYAKDGSGDIDWKRVTKLIFLIAVIAVLTCSVTAFLVSTTAAPLVLGFAAVVLTFFAFLQDWYKIHFEDVEKKNHGEEESGSRALIKRDEKNGDFAAGAEAEFRKITKVMKEFTGAFEELRQVANSFNRMLEDGRKAIEDKMKEDKNKSN